MKTHAQQGFGPESGKVGERKRLTAKTSGIIGEILTIAFLEEGAGDLVDRCADPSPARVVSVTVDGTEVAEPVSERRSFDGAHRLKWPACSPGGEIALEVEFLRDGKVSLHVFGGAVEGVPVTTAVTAPIEDVPVVPVETVPVAEAAPVEVAPAEPTPEAAPVEATPEA